MKTVKTNKGNVDVSEIEMSEVLAVMGLAADNAVEIQENPIGFFLKNMKQIIDMLDKSIVCNGFDKVELKYSEAMKVFDAFKEENKHFFSDLQSKLNLHTTNIPQT